MDGVRNMSKMKKASAARASSDACEVRFDIVIAEKVDRNGMR